MPGDINPHIPDEISEKEQVAINEETSAVGTRLQETGVLDPQLIAAIKQQVTAEVVADLKESRHQKEKELEILREMEDIEYKKYVATMKESDDPWVDFVGQVRDTAQGQRLQMDWNNAFIEYLRENNIPGANEEQMVQKYISLLLRDMTDKMEARYGSDFE